MALRERAAETTELDPRDIYAIDELAGDDERLVRFTRTCARGREVMATTGSSTARICGSPTGRWPMSPSYGPKPTAECADFWWSAAAAASPRRTCIASFRCARR